MEHRRQVSKAEIERARELDLLTYLQTYEPHELVRISSAVYSTRSHDSLKISNGKWFQWSTGVGGVSALDYLVKVQGMDFVSAVLRILECTRYATPTKTYTPKRAKPMDFVLPAPHENNDRVAAYLTGRGLSEDLLNMYFNMGLVYEDRRHNCVFVGFDKDTVPRYAMLRSSDPSSTFCGRLRAAISGIPFPRRIAAAKRCLCLKAPLTAFPLSNCSAWKIRYVGRIITCPYRAYTGPAKAGGPNCRRLCRNFFLPTTASAT